MPWAEAGLEAGVGRGYCTADKAEEAVARSGRSGRPWMKEMIRLL
jgi:hypothetical protein